MRSRWISMAALVVVAGLALAMAAPAVPSQPAATGQAVLGAAAPTPAPDATAGDPYLAQSQFTTQAPEPMVGCQVYAYQCVFDGGPCGPGGFCHCQNNPDFGWICAR